MSLYSILRYVLLSSILLINNNNKGELMTSSITDISIPDFNYSRPLDVHRWSDYSEVNDFVNEIS